MQKQYKSIYKEDKNSIQNWVKANKNNKIMIKGVEGKSNTTISIIGKLSDRGSYFAVQSGENFVAIDYNKILKTKINPGSVSLSTITGGYSLVFV